MDIEQIKNNLYFCSKCGKEVVLIKKGLGVLSCCGQPMENKLLAQQEQTAKKTGLAEDGRKVPYFEKQVDCPVCKASTPNIHMRAKCFMPKKQEIDQHVLEYAWSDPEFEGHYPPFYALDHCANCGFTDFPAEFKLTENKRFINSAKLIELISNEKNSPSSITNMLSKHIDPVNVDFQSAFFMHLLAIHLQTLPKESKINYEKLGRLYLRTAWLFRDSRKLNIPPSAPCFAIALKLGGINAQLPHNERFAIRCAVDCFFKALDTSDKFNDPVTLQTTVTFIANLQTMMEDYDAAIETISGLVKEATQNRTNLYHKKNDEKASPKPNERKIKEIDRQLALINASLMNTKDKIVGIRHTKLDSRREQIQKVLAEHQESSGEKLSAALELVDLDTKDIELIADKRLVKDPDNLDKSIYWHPNKGNGLDDEE